MLNKRTSAIISLVICVLCSLLLVLMLFTFPSFMKYLYLEYHNGIGNDAYVQISDVVVPAFYVCSPFAAFSLYMLIRLLLNIIKEDIFIMKNAIYFRLISWCCYAVTIITAVAGFRYIPLFVIAVAMAIVGTLLRVVKNIMQSAVVIREENDLTI